MKTLLTAVTVAAVAFLVLGGTTTPSHGQCILHCPAGDGGVGPGNGTKSVDLNSDAVVDLIDLAAFALAYPPNPYSYCADFNCDGIIDLVDFSIFAIHWMHQGTPGFCQPNVDHYKPYEVFPPYTVPGPITLIDQFGITTHNFMFLSKLATPVEKNDEGILDPIAHQTWYELEPFPEPQRIADVENQFGRFEWAIGEARYLVLPALKNPDPPIVELPVLNHYKCYDAFGPILQIPVRLRDQFELVDAIVFEPRYFCNPVEKITPDGLSYPIVDKTAHLTCYFIESFQQYGFDVQVWDQFLQVPVTIEFNELLCLPAVKHSWTEAGASQWQRIKALYDGINR